MSARIKVRPSPYTRGFIWWDCSVLFCPGGYGGCDTIAEAANAGRKHVREVHAPTVGIYCRAHGCHRDICGCGCSHTPKPPESRSDFVPTISAACIGGDARTQIHICTKCGLVSTLQQTTERSPRMRTPDSIERNVRFLIGQCPMCKTRIYADVNMTIDLSVSDLGFTSGEATVEVSGKPRLRKVSIHHDCGAQGVA